MESATQSTPHLKYPFRFGDTDYHTTEELARAWAASESPWTNGADSLRYVEQWLDTNGRAEEARRVGELNAEDELNAEENPELAVFRFVNENAKIPFGAMGHVVDANNLHLFLGRTVRREASYAERTLVEMLSDGRLLTLYEEYSRFGETNPKTRGLLAFMSGKTAAEQWGYSGAIQDPGAYIWPEQSDHGTPDDPFGILEALRGIGVVPVRRDELSDIERDFVVPRSLTEMFGEAGTYAEGARLLERWRVSALLIPREQAAAPGFYLYEDLSVAAYERESRAVLFGHTADVLRRLRSVSESFEALRGGETWPVAFLNAADRVNSLADEKITGLDAQFLGDALKLLDERRGIAREHLPYCGVAGAIGGVLAAFVVSVISPMTYPLLWLFLSFILLAAIGVYLGARKWERRLNSTRLDDRNLGEGCAIAGFVLLVVSRGFIFIPGFPLLVGAAAGACIGDAFHQRALSENKTRLTDACEAYLYDRGQRG
jgi:hypothetical protein